MKFTDLFLSSHDSLKNVLETTKQKVHISRDGIARLIDEYDSLRYENDQLKEILKKHRDCINTVEL